MIKVIKAGFYTTIQDLGRVGYRSYGVPQSGVMDAYSAKLANSIVGNQHSKAVIECADGGIVLEFLEEAIICISGADFNGKINEEILILNRATYVSKSSVISFGKRNFGARFYIAIRGGLMSPEIMGSKSFYFGITPYFRLEKGMKLQVNKVEFNFNESNAIVKLNKEYFHSELMTCFPGPEFELLSKFQKDELLHKKFTISVDSNRMGYRLLGDIENSLPSMLTSSVLPGTVQLTPSGGLIVLMRDGQVTGGYPRVLQLTEEAINRLGQKVAGDSIQFVLNF